VDRSVERVRHAELQPAGDGNVHAALEVPAVRPVGLDRRAGEDDEVGDLAALERQLHDPFLIDDGADAGAADVHERRRAFDGYGLLDVAQGERDIDRRPRIDLQHDAGLHVGAEPLQRDLQLVGTDRQVRHGPGARRVRDDRARESRGGLRGRRR
jgi:hypothetical protein